MGGVRGRPPGEPGEAARRGGEQPPPAGVAARPTMGRARRSPPVEPKKGAPKANSPPSAATRRYPGPGAGTTRPEAWPESGETISEDSSTASNWAAGMVLSSSSTAVSHPLSAEPVKNQSEPLSARISP